MTTLVTVHGVWTIFGSFEEESPQDFFNALNPKLS